MQNNPLVSIIIPTYNRAHLISETLDSVLAQTYTNWECIIVDDGSFDNTDEVLGNYVIQDARFKYYHRPKNTIKGANACRNYGFQKSSGEYVIFLDSDDLLLWNCLENRLKCFSENSFLNLLVSNIAFLDSENKIVNRDPVKCNSLEYLEMFLSYNVPWQTTAATYKRELLENVTFDENLQRFQDVSFNIKILLNDNIRMLRDFKLDAYYRQDDFRNNTSSFKDLVLNSLIVFLEIHRFSLNLNTNRRLIQIFIFKILNDFVFFNYKENMKSCNSVFKYLLRSDIYSFNQKIFLIIKWGIMYFELSSIKGIGIYRFDKMFRHRIVLDSKI
ncbi:glycosyltransferase family 2 protein [Flavobacterium sp. MAHUQ-51]|uniref:glycosyltransferase family 2 protein n=1 Tax=Flavobacterium sp. GCM10022190 TaxID=3252639 RepID=UPI00361A27D4